MVLTADPYPMPTTGNNTIAGNAFADVLSGYSGNDRLYGGAGDDIFQEGLHVWQVSGGGFLAGTAYDLGLGNDYFDGGTGFDLLSVWGTDRAVVLDLSAESLVRGEEIDRFSGVEAFELGLGNDLLTGLRTGQRVDLAQGDDRAVGIAAGIYLDGGEGTDLLDLRLSAVAVDIDQQSEGLHAGSLIHGFEIVWGALDASNAIRGTEAGDTLTGGLLDDALDGYLGNDSLRGEAGNDRLQGSTGNDTLYGEAGNDRLEGWIGDDALYGGAGNDELRAIAGNDLLYGGDGDDTLQGSTDSSLLEDRDGANLFLLVEGNDTVIGGRQNDTVRGMVDAFSTLGRSVIDTGQGDDLVILSSGKAEVVTGGGHDDLTIGQGSGDAGAGNDTLSVTDFGVLYGGAGDDILHNWGTFRTSRLYGGDGNDSFVLHDYSGGTIFMDGGDGDDSFVVTAGHYADLVLSGGEGRDLFDIRQAGNVTIDGGDEDMILTLARAISLTYHGGRGVDDVRITEYGPGRGKVELGGGDDLYDLVDLTDFTTSIAISGGRGHDHLNSQARIITGDTGNDTIRSISDLTDIYGGTGDDLILLEDAVWFDNSDVGSIYGGLGRDHLIIGEGGYAIFAPDVLTGDSLGIRGVFGVETITIVGSRTWIADHRGMDFSLGDDSDTINAYVAGHAHDLGDGNDGGGAFADDVTIFGGAGNDYLESHDNTGSVLYGSDGNDQLFATCNSSLYGGTGEDQVRNWLSWAGWSGDRLVISTGEDADEVMLSGAHGEVYLGSGDDLLSAFGFNPVDTTDLIVETGGGRDVIAASSDKVSRITVTDFDVALDRLEIWGVARLRDFDSHANGPEGVTLVLGELTIVLEGVRSGDLDASVFLSL